MPEGRELTVGETIYLAGVIFSLGIRIGQMPLWGPDALTTEEGIVLLFINVLLSLLSWFGAGLAIGNP